MKAYALALGINLGLTLSIFPGPNDATSNTAALSEHKPFAEEHVILQVSQSEPARYRAALDIASNLSKHYGGQDMIDVQVIAFGPGVEMLFATENQLSQRISSLMHLGVRFYVCGNTLDTIERNQKQRPELLRGVTTVQTGVAYLIGEIRKGYVHVHP